MTFLLKRMIYGKPLTANQRLSPFETLGLSDDLDEGEALAWRAGVNIEPFPDGSASIGVFAAPSGRDFIAARAEMHHDVPIYEYVALPRAALRALEGNLAPLMRLFAQPLPDYTETDLSISTLELDDQAWAAEQRRAAAETLLARFDLETAMVMVSAAISERGLLIRGAGDFEQRLGIVAGLLALLPAAVRPDLTFVLHTPHIAAAMPRLLFSDSPGESPHHRIDLISGILPQVDSLYTRALAAQNGSTRLDDLLGFVDRLDTTRLPETIPLGNLLNVLVQRHELDRAILAGEDVPVEQVQTALANDPPGDVDLRRRYVSRLLEPALTNRDPNLAALITREMDQDPALDAAVEEALTERLDTQPDEVYAFVRARLNVGAETRWIPRLQSAAMAALQVAILDGDSETVVNWLKLVAREPLNYNLGEVLQQAILAARERARQDGEIAKQLYLIAMRRAHTTFDTLLADPILLAVLPNDAFGLALREHDPAAIDALYQKKAYEPYLVAVGLATHQQIPEVVNVETVERVWELLETPLSLLERYQPMSLLRQWADTGIQWMPLPAVETLMTLSISGDGQDLRKYDDLFLRASETLQNHPSQVALLTNALRRSKRSALDILDLTSQYLQPQQAVNLYVALLAHWEWRKTALAVVEQMARLLQQSPTLMISPDPLWKMLELGEDTRNDLIVRVASKRLAVVIELIEDDTLLIGSLMRIHEALAWNLPARATLMGWWRRFVRGQPLSRLQRLDKALDGKRSLDDARDVVQTITALRKLLGKRNWKELAHDVATTYNIIEALSESFDPTPKHPISFDQDTVREELDAHQNELETQERTILANNFKELAQLISSMGDNRSKSSIVRRDLDRQLMTGEQTPQSAIDVLKWLAGYLGGVQDKEDEEET